MRKSAKLHVPSGFQPVLCHTWESASLEENSSETSHAHHRFDRSCEFVVLDEGDTRAIWTAAWLLVERGDRPELFVKPDDRWDVNPVQDRCRWIAEDLGDVLAKICEQLRANVTPAVESLADELVYGLE